MKLENKSFFKLTLPIFLEMFLLMLMGNIDIFMLSRYSEDAVVAASIANQYIQFSIVMFGFISSGAAVIVAQYLGASKIEEARNVSGLAIYLGTAFGVIISIVFFLFRTQLLNLMELNEIELYYSEIFLRLVGGFIFLQAALSTVNAILRSYGRTKDTLKITLFMNTLSAIGNAIFIFGLFGAPILGIFGVAITTNISRAIALILALFLLFKQVGNPFVKIKNSKSYIKKILKIGIPAAGENLSYTAYQMFFTMLITAMATVEMHARVYTRTLNVFMFLATFAIAQGGQIIIGRLMGEKKYDEIYKKCYEYLKMALIGSLITSIIFFLLSNILLGIFTQDEEVLALGRNIFALFILLEIGRAFNLILIGSLRATGDVQFPVLVGIFHMWGVGALIGFVLAVVFNMGVIGIVIATALEELFRGVIMFFRWKSKKWIKKGLV
ncbi:MAG: MATE family efflux transporter [Defluviitaleaceae bacterium]|nr:MATE family efflux transporter [Defluviitaleaceae bacterium]